MPSLIGIKNRFASYVPLKYSLYYTVKRYCLFFFYIIVACITSDNKIKSHQTSITTTYMWHFFEIHRFLDLILIIFFLKIMCNVPLFPRYFQGEFSCWESRNSKHFCFFFLACQSQYYVYEAEQIPATKILIDQLIIRILQNIFFSQFHKHSVLLNVLISPAFLDSYFFLI